jgi:DNA-directed RNA polymerase specialized sigma24 family protein
MRAEKRYKLVEFFRSEYTRLVGYVRKMIDDMAARDGEDIVQDVILNAFNLAGVNAPIENVSAYLYYEIRTLFPYLLMSVVARAGPHLN